MRISDWSSDVWSSDLAGAASRIQTCAQLEDALEGVDDVQESLPEIVELKKEIFGSLDRLSRSEDRRVAKEFVSSCRSRWSSAHYTINRHKYTSREVNDIARVR